MSTVKRPSDPNYKATLGVALHGARLQFHVAQDLFSSASLDPGTAALLRTLAGAEYSRVLDLGCGYGPLGLFLKAWRPEAAVHAVDRDALAVAYTQMNAALNGLAVDAYPSLGYDDVPVADRFDLIVSNIPAKAGPRVIESLLSDGAAFLADGGRMAVVAIDRIAGDVRAAIPEPELEWSNRGYTVFHYRPPAPPAPYDNGFQRGIYDRGRLRHKDLDVATVWGLHEFDTPSFSTLLALGLLPQMKATHIRVVNPGQGLVPAAARVAVNVDDRDLLALRNTARNATLVDGDAEAVVVLLRDHEPVAVTRASIAGFGRALVAGTSTQVTRLVEATGADTVARDKTRGFSAALLRMPS
jgi:SAM-dependent methyltransferase